VLVRGLIWCGGPPGSRIFGLGNEACSRGPNLVWKSFSRSNDGRGLGFKKQASGSG
jgi:hypothetical protein